MRKLQKEGNIFKKRKRGLILILIGAGIIFFFFFFFSEKGHGAYNLDSGGYVERYVELGDLEFDFKIPLLVGGIIILVGAGTFAFSFIPE